MRVVTNMSAICRGYSIRPRRRDGADVPLLRLDFRCGVDVRASSDRPSVYVGGAPCVRRLGGRRFFLLCTLRR